MAVSLVFSRSSRMRSGRYEKWCVMYDSENGRLVFCVVRYMRLLLLRACCVPLPGKDMLVVSFYVVASFHVMQTFTYQFVLKLVQHTLPYLQMCCSLTHLVFCPLYLRYILQVGTYFTRAHTNDVIIMRFYYYYKLMLSRV